MNVLKAIRHICNIQSSLGDVFLAVTSSEEMEKWMGEQTIMNSRVNGHFVYWKGKVVGTNKYVSLRSLVQEWKLKDWKSYSQVTLNLHEDRAAGITQLEIIHENTPSGTDKEVDKFWNKTYFPALKKYLEK